MAPPVALVLGGGASFGAVQVGMVQALAEVGIVGDLVVGTSVGALNGAVLAADPATAGERLLGMWQGLRRQDVFPAVGWSGLRRMHRQDAHLVDVERLERVVAAALPVASFEELATPFTAVAVDLDAGGVHELDAGPLVPALLASASIPGSSPRCASLGARWWTAACWRTCPSRRPSPGAPARWSSWTARCRGEAGGRRR